MNHDPQDQLFRSVDARPSRLVAGGPGRACALLICTLALLACPRAQPSLDLAPPPPKNERDCAAVVACVRGRLATTWDGDSDPAFAQRIGNCLPTPGSLVGTYYPCLPIRFGQDLRTGREMEVYWEGAPPGSITGGSPEVRYVDVDPVECACLAGIRRNDGCTPRGREARRRVQDAPLKVAPANRWPGVYAILDDRLMTVGFGRADGIEGIDGRRPTPEDLEDLLHRFAVTPPSYVRLRTVAGYDRPPRELTKELHYVPRAVLVELKAGLDRLGAFEPGARDARCTSTGAHRTTTDGAAVAWGNDVREYDPECTDSRTRVLERAARQIETAAAAAVYVPDLGACSDLHDDPGVVSSRRGATTTELRWIGWLAASRW